MKRKVLAMTCSLIAACTAAVLLAPKMIETRVLAGANADGSVTISSENFPDSSIMGSVQKCADENNDWVLSGDEL